MEHARIVSAFLKHCDQISGCYIRNNNSVFTYVTSHVKTMLLSLKRDAEF